MKVIPKSRWIFDKEQSTDRNVHYRIYNYVC